MTRSGQDGVLLVAHGTISDLDDLPEFVARIRHGRPAPPGLLEELRRRYEAIGRSPLLDLTKAQGAALARVLEMPVLVGMRLWHPSVEETLRAAALLGLSRLCVLPLAPYSVRVYAAAAERSRKSVEPELGDRTPSLVPVEPWGLEPALIRAHADRVRAALGDDDRAPVVLTAHSLPLAALRGGDQYEAEFRASAAAVAAELGRPCEIAFQSQGADGGDWLGPDLASVLARVAQQGARRVAVAPIGFLAEHVETLYDLDIEARAQAADLGISVTRVPALNESPGLIEAMAAVARRALGS